MKCKSGKRAELDWLIGNSLKFDDDAELQSRLWQLCERVGVNLDHNTGRMVWAAIGMRLARDQPEFQKSGAKRRGRPKGTFQPRTKFPKFLQAFVRVARCFSSETGVPVKRIITSAAYGAQIYNETGKEPKRDQSDGMWRCLLKYKSNRKVLERRLLRCNEAFDREQLGYGLLAPLLASLKEGTKN